MKLNIYENAFFELLKNIIWGSEINLKGFEKDNDDFWKQIIDLAVNNGLYNMLIDSLNALPKEYQPSKTIKLAWVANNYSIEETYRYTVEACCEIQDIFHKNGLKFMVMKGIGLSTLYPNPVLREFGDIDFYVFGDYDKANEVAEKAGAILDSSPDYKHKLIHYKGVPLENHKFFTNQAHYTADKIIENYLNKTLERDECVEAKIPNTDKFIMTPPANFNALFLTKHMLNHFPTNLCFRQLVDWCIFLKHYHDKIDKTFLLKAVTESDYLDIASILSSVCVKTLGLNPEYNPYPEVDDSVLEYKVFHSILYYGKPVERSKNPLISNYQKFSRFWRNRWKNKLTTKKSTLGLILLYFKMKNYNILDIFDLKKNDQSKKSDK